MSDFYKEMGVQCVYVCVCVFVCLFRGVWCVVKDLNFSSGSDTVNVSITLLYLPLLCRKTVFAVIKAAFNPFCFVPGYTNVLFFVHCQRL